MEDLFKVRYGNLYIGKNLEIRPPANRGACFLPISRLYLQLFAFFPADLSLFKVQGILISVTPDRDIHIFRGILRGAGAKPVSSERIVIIAAVVVFILAARIQLTENELPVPAFFVRVPVQRAAAAEILHFDGMVLKNSQRDQISMAFTGFIDRIGEDFKHCMFTTLQPV